MSLPFDQIIVDDDRAKDRLGMEDHLKTIEIHAIEILQITSK
jgi:hypothetical protein